MLDGLIWISILCLALSVSEASEFRNDSSGDYTEDELETWEACFDVETETQPRQGNNRKFTSNIHPEFRFFSPIHREKAQYVTKKNFTSWPIENSGFRNTVCTKFIVHGFVDGNALWPLKMKNAILEKDGCNVFVIDWVGGEMFNYDGAAKTVPDVGYQIGLFIRRLIEKSKLDPKKIHIIGHSLGAHIAGFAGKTVKNEKMNNLVGRITGLDPAGPGFYTATPEDRLDASDAEFVDVIHTNWACNAVPDHLIMNIVSHLRDKSFGFGLSKAIGHFDFYPNGGMKQPGCLADGIQRTIQWISAAASTFVNKMGIQINSENEATVKAKLSEVPCSHMRAYKFFTESIQGRECQFQSVPCSSWDDYKRNECGSCNDAKTHCVKMGYYADQYKDLPKGKYSKFFLRTRGDEPFCMEKRKKNFFEWTLH